MKLTRQPKPLVAESRDSPKTHPSKTDSSPKGIDDQITIQIPPKPPVPNADGVPVAAHDQNSDDGHDAPHDQPVKYPYAQKRQSA